MIFTRAEIFDAVRQLATEAEAASVADAFEEHWSASGDVDINVDTLALLSLLSERMRQKVDAYRKIHQAARRAEAQAAWELRREEIRELIQRRPPL